MPVRAQTALRQCSPHCFRIGALPRLPDGHAQQRQRGLLRQQRGLPGHHRSDRHRCHLRQRQRWAVRRRQQRLARGPRDDHADAQPQRRGHLAARNRGRLLERPDPRRYQLRVGRHLRPGQPDGAEHQPDHHRAHAGQQRSGRPPHPSARRSAISRLALPRSSATSPRWPRCPTRP